MRPAIIITEPLSSGAKYSVIDIRRPLSADELHARAVNAENDARLNEAYAKSWVDETGDLVPLA